MMLVETGGRERTEREYAALFATAGFEIAAVHQLDGVHYNGRVLIEGVPVAHVESALARGVQ
jgi:hypothetical protein